jgi:hypothetical protein
MPSFLFILLRFFMPSLLEPLGHRITMYLLLLIFITTFLIPAMSLLGLKSMASISSLKLEKRNERVLPFSLITIIYITTAYMFKIRLDINPVLTIIFISYSLLVLILTLITVFWKISIHSAALGGVVGYLLALAYIFPDRRILMPLTGIILLSGITLSSRLQLNAHKPAEIYTGYTIGLIVGFTSIFFGI